MKVAVLLSLFVFVFFIWAAFNLMDVLFKKRTTNGEKIVYTLCKWIYYIAAAIVGTYLIADITGLDRIQSVLIFFIILLVLYFGCGFFYDMTRYRDFPELKNKR